MSNSVTNFSIYNPGKRSFSLHSIIMKAKITQHVAGRSLFFSVIKLVIYLKTEWHAGFDVTELSS